MLTNRNSSTSKIVQSLLGLVKNSIDTAIRVEGAVIWCGIVIDIARLDLFQSYGGLALARGFLNLFIEETKARSYMRIGGEAAEGLLEIQREEECSANYGFLLKVLGLIKDGTVFAGTWFFKGTVASEIFVAVSIASLLLTAGKSIYQKYRTGELTPEDKIQIALDSLSSLGTISILWKPSDGFGKAIMEAKEGKVSTYYKVTSAVTTAIDGLASLTDFFRVGKSAVAVKNAVRSRAEVSVQAAGDPPYHHSDSTTFPMHYKSARRRRA